MTSPLLVSTHDTPRLISDPLESFSAIADRWRPPNKVDGLWELSSLTALPPAEERALQRDAQVRWLRMTKAPRLVQTSRGHQRLIYDPLYLERDGVTLLIDGKGHIHLVNSRLIAENIVTDNGGTALLKNTWNSAGSAVAIMNHILISFANQGCTTQTGATINNASGAQTSIACAALPAAIPANATVSWSYGTTNAETWTVTAAGAAAAATSIPVNSQTTAGGHTHTAGDNIVPIPTVTDNPSSINNVADSGALSAGAFTFSGTGAGNRQVQIVFTFGTGTTAGNYTEAYTANSGTPAAGIYASHLIFPSQTINSTTSLQLTILEKL